jgi:membrane protein
MFVQRLKTAGAYWIEDQAAQMGAALAYYTLFSLAPLLIIALAIASQAYGEETARGEVIGHIRDFSGEESAGAVQTMLENFRKLPTGAGPAIVGLVSLLFGALGVFTQLRASLHRIWRLEEPPAQGIFLGLVKNYLLAFVMVQLMSLFVLLMLTTSTVLVAIQRWWRDFLPGDKWAWYAGYFAASTLLLTLLFAFTFRFMSDGRIPYRQLWRGALVGAVLFSVGKLLIGWYLGYSQLASAYGAAGSLVVFLAWMYYSAQIFFFGAEVVRVQRELHKH